MGGNHKTPEVLIIGAGMIVTDLILPAVLQLKRQGQVGQVTVCDAKPSAIRALQRERGINQAFPEVRYRGLPRSDEGDRPQEGLFRELLKEMPPHQAVVAAVPDQDHYEVVMAALKADQHVLCVKPLVHTFKEAREIEAEARARGLLVGIEYHKRRDRRALISRRRYRAGDFGRFVMGEAKMIEPYYYRLSNFQNWFRKEETDPFVYVGCHYVDLVAFITGLRPSEVRVQGVEGRFPNGVEAYLWANASLRFENGALMSVTCGLGYPDQGAGPNEQGLSMFFEGENRAGVLKHNDQFRGAEYGFLEPQGPGKKLFHYINPDFMQWAPHDGPGFKPIGYGPDSVQANILAMARIEAAAAQSPDPPRARREAVAAVNERGLIATPANSFYNELVHEAARASILADGEPFCVDYEPEPRVRAKHDPALDRG